MDPTRWNQIRNLFLQTVDLPRDRRTSFVHTAAGGDEALARDVLAMLEEDARGESLLDRDVADVAARMLNKRAPAPPQGAFDPYRITSVLGEGGMGVVYRAERVDLGISVAIKVLRDAWLSPARRDRFFDEQKTLAQLNHPSIARLYDADVLADGTPWFVMELVNGLPLTDYCRLNGISIRGRLELFRGVCEAVRHAHQHLVIHRDLKPSNILVEEGGRIKLLDFGISKQLDQLESPADQTRTALRLMTPAYAAPEQVSGGPVSVETDVYSLGVILYELLAGRLPSDLSRRTPVEKPSIVYARGSNLLEGGGRPAGPGKRSWDDLDVLCLTAMNDDPPRRYRSAEALIRDVDHYLRGEPLEARPDSLRYRGRKFLRRNWRPLSAAALAVVTLAGLVAFYTIRLAAARNAALEEAARTERIQSFMLNLFEGGDKEAGPAENLRVTTLIDRGVLEARSLASDPVVQAELYATLGDISQKLGNLDRADSLLRSALDRRRALFGPGSPQAAESLVALGLLRTDQAQYAEAERLLRAGLENARRTLPPGHPEIANATAALGKLLEDEGAYDKAIPVLEEAVKLRSVAGRTTPELAASLYELANTHFYAGHYDVCESLNRRALALHRELYGDRHPTVSDDYVNLGAIQYERGHYKEAESLYRQALDITQAWYGTDHYKTAGNLTMLGRALNKENRLEEALALLQQSLSIRERVYGKRHPSVASAVNELGTIALIQRKYDEAEKYFGRMVDIYRSVYGERGHYLNGIALSNLGSVYLARKQWDRAEPLFREAISLYVEKLSADHLNTGIARIKLGRTLVGEKRYVEAEAESLAGYEVLRKQMDPTVSWLQNARKDLIVEYEALGQLDKAAKFRTELAATVK